MHSEALSQTPATDHRVLEFATLIFEVESKLRAQGLLSRAHYSKAAHVFAALSSERRQEIFDELTTTLSELDQNLGLTRLASVTHLKTFLNKKRLSLKDESFIDLIEGDDVIEVYDPRGVQLWRNWVYYSFSPYTPAELYTEDWNGLYVRPASVAERLFAMMPKIFEPHASTLSFNLPEYLLSARKYPETDGLLFTQKFATPVLDHVGQPCAFVCTGRVKIVPNMKRGLNIDFI